MYTKSSHLVSYGLLATSVTVRPSRHLGGKAAKDGFVTVEGEMFKLGWGETSTSRAATPTVPFRTMYVLPATDNFQTPSKVGQRWETNRYTFSEPRER
jgi:hypothetical protein